MTRILQGLQTILNGATATGPGALVDVTDYRTVVFHVFSTGSAAATIKFGASISHNMPDFSSPPSATNPYSFVQIVNLNTNAPLDGSTGIVLSGTDATGQLFEVNTNYIKWLCPIVTAYTTGTITIEQDAANNYAR